ncbi:MAG: hypothetical protein V3T60_15980 [Candidatus Binatia bacterium]
MGILDIRWRREGRSPYRELQYPTGSFRVRYGWVYVGTFRGREYRVHLCVDQYQRLCAVIEGERSAVLEMPSRFMIPQGNGTTVYHDGAMTVRSRIPNRRTTDHVASRCPALISDGRVLLGMLRGRRSSWQNVELQSLVAREPNFLKRLLAYALLRQQLKEEIRGSVRCVVRKLQRNSPASRMKYGSGGESPEHRRLKEYVARRPWLLNLPGDLRGECEYQFLTGDRADIVFVRDKRVYAIVEVETARSDAEVGMYQAVKYRCLAAASLLKRLDTRGVRAFLIAPRLLPEVRRQCKRFEVQPRQLQLPIDRA